MTTRPTTPTTAIIPPRAAGRRSRARTRPTRRRTKRPVPAFAWLVLASLAACTGAPAVPADPDPVVTITSPTTSTTASYTLAGTATDASGVTALRYALNGGAPRAIDPVASPFQVALTLAPGANAVTVSAEDAAGNEGSAAITVTYAPTPGTAPVVTGDLLVTIAGLPAGEAADVTVRGQGAYQRAVTATTLLEDLAPESYTVEARNVTAGGVTYVADPPQSEVAVAPEETAAAAVSYRRQDPDLGSLAVTLSGLPTGAEASVTVTGPGGFSRHFTGSFALVDLDPGDYAVAAAVTQPDSATFSPDPPRQSVAVVAGGTATAHVGYTCTRVNPPDFGLEEGLRDALGIANGDLTCADLETLSVLDPTSLGIRDPDLEGLQYAVNLEVLDLAYNDLDALSEDALRPLRRLLLLDLSENALTTLPAGAFSGLSALQEIDLSGNALTTLPPDLFAGLTSLQSLDLADNALKVLPDGLLTGLAGLTDLFLERNQLTAVAPGAFADLTKLAQLRLDSNEIDDLSVRTFDGLKSLTSLYLEDNALTNLPTPVFSGLARLQTLDLSRNALTALPGEVFADLSALETLSLNSNALTALPVGLFAGLSSLETLYLHSNALAALHDDLFAGQRALRTLRLNDNLLTTLAKAQFSKTPALQTLYLNDNCLVLDESPVADVLAGLNVTTLVTQDNPRTDVTCPAPLP